jgi:hypothetical protein
MNRKPTKRKNLKRRLSFWTYKGHQVELVTQPPYAWRISIDGRLIASFAGTLIQAKRHAKDLISRGVMAQDAINDMQPSAPPGSVAQSAIEEKTPTDPKGG